MTTLPTTLLTATVPTVRTVPTAPARPSAARRTAVGAAGLLACALPVVWGCAVAGMLATGTEADHRFHQVTGQGLLLSGVWLGGLVPLVRAGLRGRRPSTAAGLHHLAFLVATVLACGLAPQAGAGAVAGVAVVTGGLLWLALPQRPRLRGALTGGPDVLLAPAALLTAALVTPFALGQVELQHAMGDEHADMAHYVDMAWVVLALVALGVVAALSPVARSLAHWTGAGLVVTGLARAAFTADVTWSVLAVALGAATTAATLLRHRVPGTAA